MVDGDLIVLWTFISEGFSTCLHMGCLRQRATCRFGGLLHHSNSGPHIMFRESQIHLFLKLLQIEIDENNLFLLYIHLTFLETNVCRNDHFLSYCFLLVNASRDVRKSKMLVLPYTGNEIAWPTGSLKTDLRRAFGSPGRQIQVQKRAKFRVRLRKQLLNIKQMK